MAAIRSQVDGCAIPLGFRYGNIAAYSGYYMKQNKAAFLKELSFQEKRTLTISFLEFTLKSYQFEFDNDPSELTTEQMEPIFAELRGPNF